MLKNIILEKKNINLKLMDQSGCFENSYGIIIEIEDKTCLRSSATSGFSDGILPLKKWKEISDYAMARKYPHEPLVQGLGARFFYSGSIRKFQFTQRSILRVMGI